MNLQTNFNTKKQIKQEVSKQWMEEVQQLLPKNLEELMKGSDTFQRKREVKCACDLLKVLLLYAVSGFSFKMLALCAHALGICEMGVEYGKEEILHLYRSRWQVELLFKRIKQNLRIQTVRAGSEAYLTSLVYLWLIVWSLVEKQVFLAEKYWIESGKKQDILSIWDMSSYYFKRIVTLIASTWSLLVDPFDLTLLEKYLSSHKRSNQNSEYRLCILDSYLA